MGFFKSGSVFYWIFWLSISFWCIKKGITKWNSSVPMFEQDSKLFK